MRRRPAAWEECRMPHRRSRRIAVWRHSGAEWVPVALSAAGVVVGWRLLAGSYTLFQHAYLGTYWMVPGTQVNSAYWGSVRFAFGQTVLVAVGVGVLASLAVVEVGRAVRR